MKRYRRLIVLMAAVLGVATARAAETPSVRDALQKAQKPAWSIKGLTDEFRVSVSPSGRTLKLIPQIGGALATSVDYLVNDRYRMLVKKALGDYSLEDVVRTRWRERLQALAPQGITEVGALNSTAGFQSRYDAQMVRLQALGKRGYDLLFDLDLRYGVYSENFDLKVTLEGNVYRLPDGKILWRGHIPVMALPFLANVKFKNFIIKQIPFTRPVEFSVDKDIVTAMTRSNGELLRAQFEKAVDGGISAALCDMGLLQEAPGEYILGRQAFMRKRYVQAQQHFVNAIRLDKDLSDALNDLSVTYARIKAYDKAIELARQILDRRPEYWPAAFNLAWWSAFEKGDFVEAARYYAQARKLGIAENGKLEKAIKKHARK